LKQLELENKDNLVETYTKQKAGILVVIAWKITKHASNSSIVCSSAY
jgi:hypothetical protein